jgi:hypothetical protein
MSLPAGQSAVPEVSLSSVPVSPTVTDVPHRLARVAGLVGWFLLCYWIVTRVTVARGPGALIQTAIPLDRLIPHLPWTWPLYWIAYPFVIAGGGATLLRLPEAAFRRAVLAALAMTTAGALIQIAFPARAPWPAHPASMQARFHQSWLILPYATLPSMHVAFCAFVAALVASRWPGRLVRAACFLLLALVVLGTLTLKEHVVLDAVTGLALGAIAARWWRAGAA